MSEYTIIRNAPAMSVGARRYPFGDMEVGDAFDAPVTERKRIANAAWHYGKSHSKRFAVRKIDATTMRCRRDA